MKEIILTNGSKTQVDDDDFEKYGRLRWRMDYHGYAIMSKQFGFKGPIKTILLHREIMDVAGIKGIDVDHKDKNPLNNQKSNLRLCNRATNLANSGPRKKNKSGYKGVCMYMGCEEYIAKIRIDGKVLYLGKFDDIVEAAKAYDEKAVEFYGEFAYTNFPRELPKI